MVQIFNKLVRDNIPNIIESNGEKAITRILGDEEYRVDKLKTCSFERDGDYIWINL